jgi:hypothetical protein
MVVGMWCFIVVDESGHTPCDTKKDNSSARASVVMDSAGPHAPFFVFNALDTVLVEGLHRSYTGRAYLFR